MITHLSTQDTSTHNGPSPDRADSFRHDVRSPVLSTQILFPAAANTALNTTTSARKVALTGQQRIPAEMISAWKAPEKCAEESLEGERNLKFILKTMQMIF